MESNQNVEYKRKSVESKIGKWGVQSKWWIHHKGDFHFQFFVNIWGLRLQTPTWVLPLDLTGDFRPPPPSFVDSKKTLNYTMEFMSWQFCTSVCLSDYHSCKLCGNNWTDRTGLGIKPSFVQCYSGATIRGLGCCKNKDVPVTLSQTPNLAVFTVVSSHHKCCGQHVVADTERSTTFRVLHLHCRRKTKPHINYR